MFWLSKSEIKFKNMKKYILLKEKKVEFGITLFRIKANIAFGIVAKAEMVRVIGKEDNLDQSIKSPGVLKNL